MKPNLSMVLGAVALAVIALLSSADSVHAQTFNPTISACLDNIATVDPDPYTPGDPEECDGDNTPGGTTDFLVQFDIPGGDVQFRWIVAFIPPEWNITPGDDIPIGTVVGKLVSQSTLGIINAPCNNSLPVEFYMLNASIEPTDTVAFNDADDNGAEDAFEDKDDSGLQDSIEKYPEFIKRIIGDAKPIRRAAGIQVVADTDVLLQFLVFEPGTFLLQEIPDDESLGYPMITFLQDNGDPDREPEPQPITDFCSPLTSSSTSFAISKDNPCTGLDPEKNPDLRDKYGLDLCRRTSAPLELPDEGISDPDESGIELFHSPEAGTYDFIIHAIGQRDEDGDTYENAFDTCPYDQNDGSPRVKGDGDLDEDGLDAACDPNDDPANEGINSDEDGDGYLNRGDNCPLIANGEEGTNQKDSDTNEQGDPRPDGIGDECDDNPDVPDGDADLVTVTSEVTIGEGGSASDGNEDGGGGGATVIIIVVVIAAVVVVGGGAFFLMRRKGT